jgi:hypothetical protein
LTEFQAHYEDNAVFHQHGEYDAEFPIIFVTEDNFAKELHEFMGWMVVFVASPSSDLAKVLNWHNGQYPDAHLLLAGNLETKDSIRFYKKLAKQFGADTIFPSFKFPNDKLKFLERDGAVLSAADIEGMSDDEKIACIRVAVKSSFRHMMIEQAGVAVKRSILKQVKKKERLLAAPPPIPAPPAEDDGSVINPGADFTLQALLRDFVVLHGHGSGVFDDRRCEFMSVTDFRNSVGRKAADEFFNSPYRKVIFRRNVVFDPTIKKTPVGFVNLYRGIKLKPEKGECKRLLDILFHLCERNDEVFQWVLSWIAYPLQHPGAKLMTAVVIHGREGAGKNLFWTAIQRIYGEYATIISQKNLESGFNGWASRKLFIVGNEVISRQEMFHVKGAMKDYITGDVWYINEKNIAERIEANRANFTFFSNFLQPVAPDKDDRRYLVLWTPPKQSKEYYKAVANERDNGGTEALYHYLLNYDLGDFNEYTEPLMTEAKMDLVELSMKSDERFVEKWLNEDLSVPLIPVLTSELYRAYKFWCRCEGEKFFVSATEFGTLLNKHELVDKKPDQRYYRGLNKLKGTFAVPYGSEPEEDKAMANWLGSCNDDFAVGFSEWTGDARD